MSFQKTLGDCRGLGATSGQSGDIPEYVLIEEDKDSNLYFKYTGCTRRSRQVLSSLALEGELRYEKACFINGIHVYFTKRKLFLFSEDDRLHFILPLEGKPLDVYVEIVSADILYVLVAMNCGVCVSLLRSGLGSTTRLDWKYLETTASVHTIHRIGDHFYTLCYNDCSLQNVKISVDVKKTNESFFRPIEQSSAEELEVDCLFSIDMLFQDIKDTGFGRLYRKSFFYSDPYLPNFILLLSDVDIQLIKLEEGAVPRVAASIGGAHKITAISPPPGCDDGRVARRTGAGEPFPVGVAYYGNGNASVIWAKLNSRMNRVFSLFFSKSSLELKPMNSFIKSNTRVSKSCFAYGGCSGVSSSTTLLYDEGTSSVQFRSSVLPIHKRLLDESKLPSLIQSTLYLDGKPIGASYVFKHVPGSALEGEFYIYTETSVYRVAKRSSDEVLGAICSNFLRSEKQNTLSKEERAGLLWHAFLAGLPIQDVLPSWCPLAHPFPQEDSLILSPGAHVLASYWFSAVRHLDHLLSYSSFHSCEDLNQVRRIRRDLEHSFAVARSAFQLGTEDGVARDNWRFSVSPEGTIRVYLDTPLDGLTESVAEVIQHSFILDVMEYVKYGCALSFLYTVSEEKVGTFELQSSLWNSDLEFLMLQHCRQLLEQGKPRVVQLLHENLNIFPKKVQLLIGFHWRYTPGNCDKSLEFVLRNIRSVVEEGLLSSFLEYLEDGEPDLLPTLHAYLSEFQQNLERNILSKILTHLQDIESQDLLEKSLSCIFSHLGNRLDSLNTSGGTTRVLHLPNDKKELLSSSILKWMIGQRMDDPRLQTFASIINEFNLPVSPSGPLTETFFWCWSEYSRGEKARASQCLAELSVTDSPCPLSARMTCIELALGYEPYAEYQYIQFLLRLQHRLLEALSMLPKTLAPPGILEQLNNRHVGEKQLLALCQEFHHVGGGIIELDILEKQGTVSMPVLLQAISSSLAFLRAKQNTPEQAIASLLHAFYHNFQTPMPLLSFVDFYLSNEGKLEQLLEIFKSESIPPEDVFTVLYNMLDNTDKGRNRYPVVEVVRLILTQVLPQIEDNSLRRRYTRHMKECIEKIDEDFRRFYLTPQELESLEEMESRLNEMNEVLN